MPRNASRCVLSHWVARTRPSLAPTSGHRAGAIYTLIQTAKLNEIDPQAWLADVLARLQDHPAKRIDELLPWGWKRERLQQAAA